MQGFRGNRAPYTRPSHAQAPILHGAATVAQKAEQLDWRELPFEQVIPAPCSMSHRMEGDQVAFLTGFVS